MIIHVQDIFIGMLIFGRLGALFLISPVFSEQTIPVLVRVLFSFSLTWVVFDYVNHEDLSILRLDMLVWLMLRELMIGLTFGFLVKLIVESLIMVVEVTGFQMGFGTANIFVPEINHRLNSFSLFHRFLSISIILSLGLHRVILKGIFESFQRIPIGNLNLNKIHPFGIVEIMVGLFRSALQVGAPLFVALLVAMVIFGLIARSVPQINIFTLSFPASFYVGMIAYMSILAIYPELLEEIWQESFLKILNLMR